MALSLAAAAELVGKHKVTLLRSIQSGRLSAAKNGFGEWELDPAEVTRLYPVKSDSPAPSAQPQPYAPALEAQIEGLKAVNVLLREQLDSERRHAEHWREVATRQLPAPTAPRSWWWRKSA